MTKLLALVALVVLAWMALRRARAVFLSSPRGQELRAAWRLLRQLGGGPAGTSSRDASSPGAAGARPRDAPSPIPLIRCAVCGTHVPETRARRRASGVYCSEACEQRASP